MTTQTMHETKAPEASMTFLENGDATLEDIAKADSALHLDFLGLRFLQQ